MSSYKFTYFDIRGRGELSRYVFIAAGQKFEDNRITGEQWADQKLKQKTPFGQLPLLEVDGLSFGQSNAIARFLAKEFGLFGKTNMDELRIDQLMEMGNDMITTVVAAVFEKDEAKKAELQKNLVEEIFPKYLEMCDKKLAENKGQKYFIGDKLSLADLTVYCLFDTPLKNYPSVMDKFPKLKEHRAMVGGLPNIAKYIKSRKETDI